MKNNTPQKLPHQTAHFLHAIDLVKQNKKRQNLKVPPVRSNYIS